MAAGVTLKLAVVLPVTYKTTERKNLWEFQHNRCMKCAIAECESALISMEWSGGACEDEQSFSLISRAVQVVRGSC